MLLSCLLLVGYGLALIYSGSLALYGTSHAALTHAVFKQAAFAVAGLLLLGLLTQIDYRAWSNLAPILYGLTIVGLLAVLVIGQRAFGSRRWFSLAVLQLQPSELAKLVTIIFLAKFLSDDRRRIHTVRGFLTALGIAAVPALLVFVEPDLGTAIVFLAVWLGMIYVAGARARHLLTFVGACVASIPFIVVARPVGLPEGPIPELHRPRQRPARCGLQHSSGANQHWLRWPIWKRLDARAANPTRLPAYSDDGLHFQRSRRRVGLHWCAGALFPLHRAAVPRAAHGEPIERRLRTLHRDRNRGHDRCAAVHQHRCQRPAVSRHRNPAAVYQPGRKLPADHVCGYRHLAKHSRSPQSDAVQILSRVPTEKTRVRSRR